LFLAAEEQRRGQCLSFYDAPALLARGQDVFAQYHVAYSGSQYGGHALVGDREPGRQETLVARALIDRGCDRLALADLARRIVVPAHADQASQVRITESGRKQRQRSLPDAVLERGEDVSHPPAGRVIRRDCLLATGVTSLEFTEVLVGGTGH